jgi:hypothetical protein
MVHRRMTNKGTRGWALSALVVIVMFCSSCSPDKTTNPQPQTSPPSPALETEAARPPADDKSASREAYVNGLRREIDRQGLEASVIDDGGTLTYTSNDFKTSEMRSLFIRSTFKPRTRQTLCDLGFKSYSVRSGVFSGESEQHSLGCPETPEEKQQRLQANLQARQAYVNDVQKEFDQHPDFNLHLQELKGELVLLAKTDDLSSSESRSVVKNLQATMDAKFDPSVRTNLCSIGFTGLSVRTSQPQVGAFESFRCRTPSSR